ncbi:hypothetical protein CPB85DRAFT_1256632 [Mucidula mucida]|nr:hypothetical protein CPB85DRAFT_1256632 [Mucidula mucida]
MNRLVLVLAVLVSVVVDGLKRVNRGGAVIQVQDVFLRLACRATQKLFDFVLVPRTNFLFDLLVKIKWRCGPQATTTTVITATTSTSTSGSGSSTPTAFSSGLRGPTTSSALSNGVSSNGKQKWKTYKTYQCELLIWDAIDKAEELHVA